MDAISSHSNLLAKTKAGRSQRVVIYLAENGTAGPIARAAKMARQLRDAGADVTVLTPKERMYSPVFADDIRQVAYDAKQVWKPSRMNPQWQIIKLRPDVLLVDEYPFVAQEHAAQWEAVIDTAKRMKRDCVVHGMTCDIPIYFKDEEAERLPKRAERLDHIWVTGDPAITDFSDYVKDEAWPHIAPKLNYVGFLNQASKLPDEPVPQAAKKKEILVYLGGGHIGRFASRYVSLLANLPLLSEPMQDAQWRFIMPEDYDMRTGSKIFTMLSSLPEAVRKNILVEQTDAHFAEKLHRADMVISGGGQSAIESVLVEGKPTLILPAFFGEQFVRAKDFAARFPDQVAAADLPTHKVTPMDSKRLRHNSLNGIAEKDWVTQTHEWAQEDAECATLRASMEKIFAASEKEHPRPQIMLDGARHIAAAAITLPAQRGGRS